MNRILILTSVIGGGHVFRDVAIAKELEKNLPEDYEIIYASGGQAYDMLREEGLKVEKVAGINFPAHSGKVNFLKLYLMIIWSELMQLFSLRFLINKYEPVLVILDEFFFLADYCRLRGIPVVFMCDFAGVPQSQFFRNPLSSLLEGFFDWYLSSYLSRRVNRWIFIGDTALVPREDWKARMQAYNILAVEPITKLQFTPPPTRKEARRKLNFSEGEKVVTSLVGCSGVGEYLLRAVNDSAPLLNKQIPDIRIELVCGKGIDPESLRLSANNGVHVHGYVRDIEVFLAASDAVVVQCGLTTATECLMIGVPMIVVPLDGHWEQTNTARYLFEKAGIKKIDANHISAKVLTPAIVELLKRSERMTSPFRGDGHIVAAQKIAEILEFH